MKIKNIEIKNNLIYAPMAGYSDFAFRSLCVMCGADYGVSEMVSAKGLFYDNQNTMDLLRTADNEQIKVAQIFGNEPNIMAQMVKSKSLEKFDIIDINMGCPAPKIVNNAEGSALMKNLNLAHDVIKACVEATDKPITVKFRVGFDENHKNCVEFAKMCERAGASAITIHGRTREQFYDGVVDLDAIKKVKESVSIPVIANGDVVDVESYKKMMEYTGCDGVMIGRGALGRPYIFSELLGIEHNKDKMFYIKKHIEILRTVYPDEFIVRQMRKHILCYLKGERNCAELKRNIVLINDLNEVISLLDKFFHQNYENVE